MTQTSASRPFQTISAPASFPALNKPAHRITYTVPQISDELRLHGELLVQLSTILKTPVDELLGLEKPTKKAGSIKNRRLYRRLQAIEKLPKRDQEALLRTIDAFLSKAN